MRERVVEMQHISEVEVKKPIQTASRTTTGSKRAKPPKRDFMRERLGMSGTAIDKTFETFDSTWQPKAYEAAASFLTNPRSLVFLGPNGIGKTHLAQAIGNALLEQKGSINAPVLFIKFDDALRQIRATFEEQHEGHGEWFYIERWTQIPVLVLDEVGQAGRAKPAGDGEFTRRIGYDIVDGRYRNGLPMIVTTNKTPNELCDWITRSGVDRLFEMGRFVKMEGKSWRQSGRR